jgi:hypothetical protein
MRVDGIDPVDSLRRFRRRYIEIDYHWFLPTTYENALERLIRIGIDFLVWYVRRHIDEITRTGFSNELEIRAPTHASATADHIDHAL